MGSTGDFAPDEHPAQFRPQDRNSLHAGVGEQESQRDQSPEKGRAPASPPTSSERGEDPRYSPVPVSIGACGLIRAMPEKY